MKQLLFSLALLAVLIIAQPSSGINYAWLTQYETSMTFPGDLRSWSIDTTWGPVHSNDWLSLRAINGILPVFYGTVSTSRPRFHPTSPTPPGQFFGGPPIFDAPQVLIPERVDQIRTTASLNGTYFGDDDMSYEIHLNGDSAVVYAWPEGTFLDTSIAWRLDLLLQESNYFFVDGKLQLRGELAAQNIEIVVGASEDIRIMDNVMLEGTNTSTGTLPDGATSKIAIASEQWILIGNTWKNGRENSAQDSDVVITALLYALRGSIQFEQMNDVGDNYIGPSPDERGTLFVTGGMTQWSHGYIHRSNRGGTGYRLKLRYDSRLTHWNNGVFMGNYFSFDTLFFADTPIGGTTWDTLSFDAGGPFSGALTTEPFATTAGYQYNGPFSVPVSFTPEVVGPAYGLLTFYLGGEFQDVVLVGNGIPAGNPQIVKTEIYPNPFNATSTLRFTLPESGVVRAIVYDVLGREVARLADGMYPVGEHQLFIGASNWSSGLHFLRFESLGRIETKKLMLIK